MNIKRVKGFLKEGSERKSFKVILENGEYVCLDPIGKRRYAFQSTTYPTLKRFKEEVRSWEYIPLDLREAGSSKSTIEENESIDKPYEVSQEHSGELTSPMWDCLHPCALLILSGQGNHPDVLVTLERWGWLNEDGTPDQEKADRESDRWKAQAKELA